MMKISVIAVCATLAFASRVQAQTADDEVAVPLVSVSPCQTHDKDAEAKAQIVADQLTAALNAGDRAGIRKLVPDMETVMATAPAPYYAEQCDNTINVYSSNMTAAIMVGAMATGDDKGNKNINLQGPTPYATIAFGLGWAYADKKDYARCITVLEDGLKRDPFDEGMIAEHLFCLAQAGRNEETVAAADVLLGSFLMFLSDPGKAAILRRKGYALVELARWDDAETAYEESLKLDPDNEVAKNELTFIRTQKKKAKAV